MISEIKYCPACLISSQVVDSRFDEDGEIVRVRQCPLCRKRWVTREILDTREGWHTSCDYYFKESDFALKGE